MLRLLKGFPVYPYLCFSLSLKRRRSTQSFTSNGQEGDVCGVSFCKGELTKAPTKHLRNSIEHSRNNLNSKLKSRVSPTGQERLLNFCALSRRRCIQSSV